MDIWAELTGQVAAVDTLRSAAESAQRGEAIAHSWLITGPPGSGRSNAAFAFAAALLGAHSEAEPQQAETTVRQVEAHTHPDLMVLSTERVIITIDEVRQLVAASQFAPTVGRRRVMVIEDADRMTERTSNLLLKALEEPPDHAIWVLCAPSEADLLPTIRSRVRSVRLRVPQTEDVAELLQRHHDVPADLAESTARQAQNHIGMARRLATSSEARQRRNETLTAVLAVRSVPQAVLAAARLIEIADTDAKAATEERDSAERESLLRSLGVEEGMRVPPALRGQVKQLEADQKRRATRSLRDGIDRILVDLLSVYRDVLMIQMSAAETLINSERRDDLRALAEASTAEATLAVIDAVGLARTRIEANVSPALALEAMLISTTRMVAE